MRERYILWGLIIFAVVATVVGAVALSGTPAKKEADTTPLSQDIAEEDHTAGPKDAKAILVEYSDFQCPACKSYYPLVKQIQEDFDGKILFVYRYFPLVSIHKNALISSYAAEAAARQDKFWEMHDKLFDTQDSWAESNNAKSIFEGYAKDLGLNVDQFKSDMGSSEVTARVTADITSGTNSKVNSTPTFFLNGKKISPVNFVEFENVIKESIGEN